MPGLWERKVAQQIITIVETVEKPEALNLIEELVEPLGRCWSLLGGMLIMDKAGALKCGHLTAAVELDIRRALCDTSARLKLDWDYAEPAARKKVVEEKPTAREVLNQYLVEGTVGKEQP